MNVRPATATDAPAVEALLAEVRAAFGEEAPAPEAARLFVERALGPGSPLTFLVCESSPGELLGIVSVAAVPTTLDAGEFVYLDDLYVRPASRGQGIGGELLAAARRWAVARGAAEIRLAADAHDEPLWRLYRDAGYARRPMSWMVLELGRDWARRSR